MCMSSCTNILLWLSCKANQFIDLKFLGCYHWRPVQGRIQDSQKGGAQIHYSEHDDCVKSTRSGMRSMPNLEGSGGMPPQKILKN